MAISIPVKKWLKANEEQCEHASEFVEILKVVVLNAHLSHDRTRASFQVGPSHIWREPESWGPKPLVEVGQAVKGAKVFKAVTKSRHDMLK